MIKADGLAAGKGVVDRRRPREAAALAIDDMLGGRFGAAGARVVDRGVPATGRSPRSSPFATARRVAMFGGAQDHKRAFDGDQRPEHRRHGRLFARARPHAARRSGRVQSELIEPALAGIAAEGAPYRGVLFCEVMVTADGPKLVEFNARFGDPECQVLMLRLESDIVPYLRRRGRAATSRPCRRRPGATRRRSAWCWRPRAIPARPMTGVGHRRRRRRTSATTSVRLPRGHGASATTAP